MMVVLSKKVGVRPIEKQKMNQKVKNMKFLNSILPLIYLCSSCTTDGDKGKMANNPFDCPYEALVSIEETEKLKEGSTLTGNLEFVIKSNLKKLGEGTATIGGTDTSFLGRVDRIYSERTNYSTEFLETHNSIIQLLCAIEKDLKDTSTSETVKELLFREKIEKRTQYFNFLLHEDNTLNHKVQNKDARENQPAVVKSQATESRSKENGVSNKYEIDLQNNKGNAQVNINSPGSNLNINEKRVIRKKISVDKARKDKLYLLRLTFQQTDGIWDNGQKFWLQLQLTSSYSGFKFLSGFPAALFNVRSTEGVAEAIEKGWIEFETTTPPLLEPIVLEIESINEIDIVSIALQPTDSYGSQ
jgi:hypothetical protein